jgi:glycosyltransferase involved in cell wall biosynthesis
LLVRRQIAPGKEADRDMNILAISTSIEGGAGRAAYRLHSALNRNGVRSQILVQQRTSNDSSIVGPRGFTANVLSGVCRTLDGLAALPYLQIRHSPLQTGWVPGRIPKRVRLLAPDIVHLHFTRSFVSTSAIRRLYRPLVWTLHDMWPFTGGCHYDHECRGYAKACGRCPQINSTRAIDLSRLVLAHKRRAWRNLDLTLVAPSRWIANCARASSLFRDRRIETIPYGLDLKRFRSIDKAQARTLLQLPMSKPLIMFGAASLDDPRKGRTRLTAALQLLAATEWSGKAELVVFGEQVMEGELGKGFVARNLGVLNDDITLALAYSAADVFVCPSIEENLPNTALEALACGTPVVGFRIGGLPDLIEHEKSGYLADPFKADDLARGIAHVISNSSSAHMAAIARTKIEREFDIDLIAKRHHRLYAELASRNDGNRSTIALAFS